MKQTPEFKYNVCIACGICVQACPVSCLSLSKTDVDKYKKAYPRKEEDTCIGCGICARNCPMDAIEMVEDK